MILSQKSQEPKRYSQKFSKLNWEKIAWRHLLKSQKYWNCKVLLDIVAATISVEFLVCVVLLILLV